MGDPALTLDGQVLDMNGDTAVFSYEKELSPSHKAKEDNKEKVRTFQWFKSLKSPDSVGKKTTSTCRVDTSGILHDVGAMLPPSPEEKSGGAARLKLFHSKRKFRRQGSEEEDKGKSNVFCVDGIGVVEVVAKDTDVEVASQASRDRQCSIDSDGVIHDASVQLLVSSTVCSDDRHHTDRLKRFHVKRATRSRSNSAELESSIVSMDSMGMVQDIWKLQENCPLIIPSAIEAC